MSPLIDLKNNWMLKYIPPGKVMHALVGRYQPQDPDSFTIRNQGDFYGGLSVEMLPPPSIARTYDFAGEFDPRALTTYKYNTGTVSSTAGTTTVTGSATVFADAHIGDVIRFAKDSTDTPDGLYGDPGGTDTPYVSQRVILAVASTTSVTIDASVPATISGVNYSISSPLDIPTNDMMNLFQRMCESGYRNLNPRECGIKERQEARMEVQSALILAMRADVHDRSDGLYDRSGWSTLDDLALRGTAAVNSSI